VHVATPAAHTAAGVATERNTLTANCLSPQNDRTVLVGFIFPGFPLVSWSRMCAVSSAGRTKLPRRQSDSKNDFKRLWAIIICVSSFTVFCFVACYDS
jgi:hypothetical protein